ncbi:predicted protein [Arabidopsis lyrata subsp. lyrata]|uniref:Predicted protein n=1 Tax=Arabidopsis lyrata subsp. lyrata TaxID=81972 RepID=D7MP12_ARALL|nr:predicted protein [Arabidopsis lyrata subsp. lyrata]
MRKASMGSDSEYAFRLQMEEALAASLSSQSRTPQRPPSPPIVARCGIAIVENDRNGSTTAKKSSGYGFDFRRAIGGGNSKGKGKTNESITGVRTDEPNPNIGLGNSRSTSGHDNMKPLPQVTGKWMAKQKKISLLLDDLQSIMQHFSSCQHVLVAGNDVKFAYKLARESILSKITPHEDPRQAKSARKEECAICFNDILAERMFSVGKCRHRFCFQCVKQHVEVKLLHGMVPKCPHDGCKSELVIDACGKLLTPKLSKMWQQRLKENAIPVTERVYCPYPRAYCLFTLNLELGDVLNVVASSVWTVKFRGMQICPALSIRNCILTLQQMT